MGQKSTGSKSGKICLLLFAVLLPVIMLSAAAYLLRKMESALGWAVLSGGFGLAFGLLCAPVDMVVGGAAYALGKVITGIPFDIAHCVGNFVIALTLFCPLRKRMETMGKRII